jgi:predicted esterase
MPIDSQMVVQLGSDDPEQRKAAIVALARSADAEALPLLVKIYRNDSDPALRELALKAGRHIKAQSKLPTVPPSVPEVVDSAAVTEVSPSTNLSRSLIETDSDAKWHYDRALDFHVRKDQAKAAAELGKIIRSNPDAVDDSAIRLLAGQITGLPPDEAIQTLTDKKARKQFEKAQPRVRKTSSRGRLRWLMLVIASLALAGAIVFFIASGALDRYRQADKINGYKQSLHQSDGLDYYLLVPGGDPPKKGWPVLLALHGNGGSGMDVFPLFADFAAREGVVLIAPTFGTYPYPAEQLVAPPLDKLLATVGKDYPLNPFGAVVYGFSAGGEAATLFAGLYPNRVAGVTVEAAPEIHPPPSNRGLPYNILYGENDEVRPYAAASVNRVQQLGYPLNYEVVPGAGHEITQRGLDLAMDMVRTVYP